MSRAVLVLGDQLFDGLPGMPLNALVFMREDFGFSKRSNYHKQKLLFVFSAMRHFAEKQPQVEYQKLDPNDTRSYVEALNQFISTHEVTELFAYEASNEFIEKELLGSVSCKVNLIPNPMFLSRREDWKAYRQSHRRLLMQDFYILQRKVHGILIDEKNQPEGGQWSFDQDNRKKLPPNIHPPVIEGIPPDPITKEVIAEVEQYFPNHPGSTHHFAYPVTNEGAKFALQEFIENRFFLFGDYEDAISQQERTVFHSLLSPLLNFGLLTPKEVIQAALEANVPLNSKEGFIRQILGWREFVFHLSREYDVNNLPNTLANHRLLNQCWYDGTTGLHPLDVAIRRVSNYAYCHHIERLMVIGSVMLMCEVSPNEAYRWFMEMFIDSADWVMLANVVGMSQFADGGLFATKPYISGSNYILKMSDYRRGEWCETWDGLYWRFLDRNRSKLEKNHRMMPMLRLLDRMDPQTKAKHHRNATIFIDRVTLPPPPSE